MNNFGFSSKYITSGFNCLYDASINYILSTNTNNKLITTKTKNTLTNTITTYNGQLNYLTLDYNSITSLINNINTIQVSSIPIYYDSLYLVNIPSTPNIIDRFRFIVQASSTAINNYNKGRCFNNSTKFNLFHSTSSVGSFKINNNTYTLIGQDNISYPESFEYLEQE